jgi:hypothetical protein
MPYLLILWFVISGFVLDAQQQVRLTWKNTPFALHKTFQLNDSTLVQIEQFKFYIEGINQPQQFIQLIDASDESTWQWKGPTSALQVGIQATLQTSGNFTGALDPINGMYWAWNTGFISVKCVGSYIHIPSKIKQQFEYHLGGYKPPFECIKEIQGSGAILACDLSTWFNAIWQSDNKNRIIMQPSSASRAIFDQFTASFSYGQ